MYSPTREGIESLLSENHALKEEIARLRTALVEITELEFTPLSDPNEISQEYRQIAFDALKGGEDD